jgi:hypothetical protein
MKRYSIFNRLLTALLFGSVAAGWMACSESDDQEAAKGSPLELVTYTSAYDEGDWGTSTRALTRGVDATLYTPDDDTGNYKIQLYMAKEGDTDASQATAGEIAFFNGRWTSNAQVSGGTNYILFGFMPTSAADGSHLGAAASTDDNTFYLNGGVLTLEGIEPVSTNDLCVLTGVQGNLSKTDAEASPQAAPDDLLYGWLHYTGKASGNNVRLLFDHIYAMLEFKMTISAKYADLRSIYLKEFKLVSTGGKMNASITLKHDGNGRSPIMDISYTSPSSAASETTLYQAEEGELGLMLETTEKYVAAWFEPTLGNDLTIISKYDVYDRKGNLIREGCEATNHLKDVIPYMERGQKLPIKLTVSPTYLYVLSDPDLDNPTPMLDIGQ